MKVIENFILYNRKAEKSCNATFLRNDLQRDISTLKDWRKYLLNHMDMELGATRVIWRLVVVTMKLMLNISKQIPETIAQNWYYQTESVERKVG